MAQVLPFRFPEIPFRIDLPVECFHKAGEPGKERRIAGIISTEHQDRQGEVVVQRGLDFSDFLGNGWFNDNHSKDTTGIVGYPLRIEKTQVEGKPATKVEGYLLDGHPPSDRIWDLANALQKTNRKLGFSIEGRVLRRDGDDGKTICEAKVSNVAITNCPVNTATGLDVLAKSLNALASFTDEDLFKAMMAGQSVKPSSAAEAGDGFALRRESLEGNKAPRVDTEEEKKKKRLTKAQALDIIWRRHPDLDRRAALRIWEFAKNKENQDG